jgi:hypothetical protein
MVPRGTAHWRCVRAVCGNASAVVLVPEQLQPNTGIAGCNFHGSTCATPASSGRGPCHGHRPSHQVRTWLHLTLYWGVDRTASFRITKKHGSIVVSDMMFAKCHGSGIDAGCKMSEIIFLWRECRRARPAGDKSQACTIVSF